MNRTIEIAPVRKSVVVDASPPQAFAVFTSGIDRWWPKSHGIGATPITQSVIEPFVGGRWYTQHEDGSDVVLGHVRVWEPAQRLVVSWEVSSEWKPDPRPAFTSEVEVRFTADGTDATNVELLHHKFETMGAEDGASMRKDVDGGWPALLELYAQDVSREEKKS